MVLYIKYMAIDKEGPQPPDRDVSSAHRLASFLEGTKAASAELGGDRNGHRMHSTLADLNKRLADAFDPENPRNN